MLRRDCLTEHVIEGKIELKIEGLGDEEEDVRS